MDVELICSGLVCSLRMVLIFLKFEFTYPGIHQLNGLIYGHKNIRFLFQGGFKLQVLDNLERPVLDLTPVTSDSEFVKTDVTAQSYQVQLPPDFYCEDCTIRLLRQASEWSSQYRFWSCADVDIKAGTRICLSNLEVKRGFGS